MTREILVDLSKFIKNFDEIYDQVEDGTRIRVIKENKSLTLVRPKKKKRLAKISDVS